jgi:hypothetical protein
MTHQLLSQPKSKQSWFGRELRESPQLSLTSADDFIGRYQNIWSMRSSPIFFSSICRDGAATNEELMIAQHTLALVRLQLA